MPKEKDRAPGEDWYHIIPIRFYKEDIVKLKELDRDIAPFVRRLVQKAVRSLTHPPKPVEIKDDIDL